mgnify:CR=1 FL=1|tara:strand:+ start:178 stop:393 length:216 start_codon:yes stop_codon:yes gene_type:complete
MDEKKFLNEIEKILELKQNSLKGNESLASINWDSLSALHFIAFVDKTLSKKLNANDIAKCKNISDLKKLCS